MDKKLTPGHVKAWGGPFTETRTEILKRAPVNGYVTPVEVLIWDETVEVELFIDYGALLHDLASKAFFRRSGTAVAASGCVMVKIKKKSKTLSNRRIVRTES